MGMKRRLFQLGMGGPGPRQAVEWEIEHHLAELTEALVEEGWEPEAARREAEERFGSVERYGARMALGADRPGVVRHVLLASLLPALRAGGVDPVRALGSD